MPAPGHSYLGDFVKDGGFIDVGYDALVDMLEGSAASDTGLSNYEEGDDKSDRVLTRNRGTILRVLSAYGDRIRDPSVCCVPMKRPSQMNHARRPELFWIVDSAVPSLTLSCACKRRPDHQT